MRHHKVDAVTRKRILGELKKLERTFGYGVIAWAFRKHLAIAAAKKKAKRRLNELKAEITRLELSAR